MLKRYSQAWLILAILTAGIPASANEWRVVYDGHGKGRLQGTKGLGRAPKASTKLSGTQAAHALSKKTEKHPLTDFKMRFKYKVNSQLRKPASTNHPWETLWLFFNYRTEKGRKKTNYLLIKENGIEVGKAWGEKEQKFVYTAAEPKLKNQNNWHQMIVTKRGNKIRVKIDRQPATVITLKGKDALYTEPGALGLYTEDSHVSIKNIGYKPLKPKSRRSKP